MKEAELKEMQEKFKGFMFENEFLGYFPKADVLERNFRESGGDLAPVVVYFAGDPYKEDPDISENPGYRATVKKAGELLEGLSE